MKAFVEFLQSSIKKNLLNLFTRIYELSIKTIRGVNDFYNRSDIFDLFP